MRTAISREALWSTTARSARGRLPVGVRLAHTGGSDEARLQWRLVLRLRRADQPDRDEHPPAIQHPEIACDHAFGGPPAGLHAIHLQALHGSREPDPAMRGGVRVPRRSWKHRTSVGLRLGMPTHRRRRTRMRSTSRSTLSALATRTTASRSRSNMRARMPSCSAGQGNRITTASHRTSLATFPALVPRPSGARLRRRR